MIQPRRAPSALIDPAAVCIRRPRNVNARIVRAGERCVVGREARAGVSYNRQTAARTAEEEETAVVEERGGEEDRQRTSQSGEAADRTARFMLLTDLADKTAEPCARPCRRARCSALVSKKKKKGGGKEKKKSERSRRTPGQVCALRSASEREIEGKTIGPRVVVVAVRLFKSPGAECDRGPISRARARSTRRAFILTYAAWEADRALRGALLGSAAEVLTGERAVRLG